MQKVVRPSAVDEATEIPLPPPPDTTFSFVNGQAGTGKSFLAQSWAREDDEAELCATTGIAAINLGGVTLNSQLGYFDTASLRDSYITGKLHHRLRKNREDGTYWYLLDEVSMLSGEALSLLTRAIQEVNQPTPVERLSGKPHRPIRLTLIGDFAQLPPVNEPFAFESEYWPEYAANQITLTEIRRQADTEFILALQAVRRGDSTEALRYFRHRMCAAISMSFDGVTIKAKNDDVDRFNYVRLEELESTPIVFSKQVWGTPRGEWKQIPENLHLKEGALVMILSNKRGMLGSFVYVNGDLGTLKEVGYGGVAHVELLRGGEVTVEPISRKNLKHATPERREELRKQGNADLIDGKHEIVGSVTYMPLRAAYATTVHKCVAADTLVQTALCGIVPISQLAAGVMLPAGRVRAVAATVQPAWRITTTQGYSVVASPDHRWLTARGLVATQDLVIHADRVQLGVGHPTSGQPFDNDTAYWLGLLVGDGNYTDRDDGTLHFASVTDQDLGEAFATGALRLGAARCSWRKDRRGLHTTSRPLRDQLVAWGLDYVTAPQKRIPTVIWQAQSGAWAAFLRGLFDTDGSIGRSGIILCTASSELAQDVQQLLLALGITARLSKYPGRRDPYWQVFVPARSLAVFKALIGFGCIRKRRRLAETLPNRSLLQLDNFDTVVSVEQLDREIPMIDVEIDAPHLMPFGPFVGHNSQGLSLDRVQVDIRNHFFTNPGSLYVALSRARTPDGLRLVGTPELFAKRCVVDQKVRSFL